jgi:ComF family protein
MHSYFRDRALATLEPLGAVASLFYPPVCASCPANVTSGEYLCPECEDKITRIVPPFCEKCSEPFSGAITNPFDCANCAHRRLYFDAAVSAFRSRGIVRKIILDFKYKRQIHLRHLVASWLFAALEDHRLRRREFDLIVPVPLHPAKERDRGFNQAALLAGLLSERMSLPMRPVLERIRHTTTQTAFDRAERMQNLHGAFRLRKNANVRQLRVLVIDDVLTTGSTLSACARVLRKAGAACIYAATAARA